MTRPCILTALLLVLAPAPSRVQAQDPPQTECGALVHAGEPAGAAWLPQGDVFCPRVADPKEPRTFLSLLRGESPGRTEGSEFGELLPFETTVGAIGVGDAIGIVRWNGARPGDGVQVSLAASIFAQFDLATSSVDLINADYIVALPVTLRHGGFSSRLRIYHQSSHLGDEFLLRASTERVNLAFESAELVLSQAFGPVRAYAGAEYLFNREPDDLSEGVVHAGLELRPIRGRAGFVAALDTKTSEEQDWTPAWSARAGLEVGWPGTAGHPSRRLRLLGEFYDGPSPYGQFYRDQVRYWGVGLHFFH